MQNLTAKKIIDFRRLPNSRKQTFVNNLRKPITKSDSGGDYWISCISAISSASKANDSSLIREKMEFLAERQKKTTYKRTKGMYQRNIDILSSFQEYDFSKLKPKRVTEFSTKPNVKSILTIKALSVQIFPNHIFSYKNNQTDEVGGVWFVAQLGGFTNEELQIFSELLYKYLSLNYSKKHTINSKFCTVVDVYTLQELKHSKLNGAESILSSTIADLKNFL